MNRLTRKMEPIPVYELAICEQCRAESTEEEREEWNCPSCDSSGDALNRLGEYEDTSLSPKGVEAKKQEVDLLREELAAIIKELPEANEILKRFFDGKKERRYRYYLPMRPPSLGTQPRGQIKLCSYDERTMEESLCREVWGLVEYDHPLTTREQSDYELIPSPLNPDWQPPES